MFVAYPLSVVHRLLLPDNANIKHLYNLLWGLFFSWLCFGVHTFVPLGTALLTYFSASCLPTKLYPKFVFVLAMATLSGVHIFRLATDYGGTFLGVNALQMILTQKVTSFAWNVSDFGNKAKGKFSKARKPKAVDVSKINLLEYLGFCFFYGGVLVGPTFEYTEYQRFTNLKSNDRPSFSSSFKAGLKSFLRGLVILGIYEGFAQVHLPYDYLFSNDFMDLHPLLRWACTTATLSLRHSCYYLTWALAEGAMQMAGMGYQGKDADGQDKWGGCNNALPLEVELAETMYAVSLNWNRSTNAWLRFYVYERALDAGFSAWLSTLITTMTSAFWHGFYAGLYMFFFLGGLTIIIARTMRRNLRPWFENTETRKTPLWYNMAGMLLTQSLINVFTLPYSVLSMEGSLKLYKRLEYIPFAVAACVVGFIFLLQMQGFHKKRVKQYKEATSSKKKKK